MRKLIMMGQASYSELNLAKLRYRVYRTVPSKRRRGRGQMISDRMCQKRLVVAEERLLRISNNSSGRVLSKIRLEILVAVSLSRTSLQEEVFKAHKSTRITILLH